MSRPFDGRRVLLGVTGGIACYKSLFVARQLTQKDLLVYSVAAQPAQSIGKALRTIATTHQRIDYPAVVGTVLPIVETGAAFRLMEHPVDKPVKVAVRGAGY